MFKFSELAGGWPSEIIAVMTSLPPSPPPLPPPSLPLMPAYPQEQKLVSHNRTKMDDVAVDIRHTGQNAVSVCQNYLKSLGACMSDIAFLSHYRPVLPIVQNGPMCGLVALVMAAHLAGTDTVSTERLLEMARDKGFTKQGEMFLADNLQELASLVIPVTYSAQVVNNVSCIDILHRLFDEEILLIPYDADKNFGPCQKRGHKAHWAVVTGFLLAFDKKHNATNLLDFLQPAMDESLELHHLETIESSSAEYLKKAFSSLENIEAIFVYAHQGKSKYVRKWLLNSLVASNENLVEADPNRSVDEYVVPPGGLRESLCNKFVTVYRNK